jgi:hypothetical protein
MIRSGHRNHCVASDISVIEIKTNIIRFMETVQQLHEYKNHVFDYKYEEITRLLSL